MGLVLKVGPKHKSEDKMKKQLLILVMLLSPLLLFSQTALDNICKKYEGKDGFTVVNVSKDLIDMIASGDDNKMDVNGTDVKEILAKVKSIKVLTCKKEKAGEKESAVFLKDIYSAIPFDQYKELVSVVEGTKVVKIVSKPDTKKDDGEFIIFVNEESSITLVDITGYIDMKNIGKLSKFMNLDGSNDKKEKKGE